MLKVVEKRDERKAGEELLVLDEIAREGAGSRTKGLLMAFKLLEMAQQRWRQLDGVVLLPLVRAGAKFIDGVQEQARTSIQSSEAVPREAA